MLTGKKRIKSIISITLAIMLTFSGFSYSSDVYSDAGNPDFNIKRSIDRTSYKEGESGTITYTITPTGTASNGSSISADIVMVFDVSPSMKANKLSNAKHAARSFLDKLSGSGAKVALVTFGYKVDYKTSLSTDYEQIKDYIWDIQNKDLFEGTNYNDAFIEAQNILKTGTSKNKYIVFLSDGIPNYFTSNSIVKKYEKNPNSKHEGSKYYYTNWPYNTPEAYQNATNNAVQMAKDMVTLINVGLGKRDEIDIDYLRELSDITGGRTYSSYKDTDLDAIYDSIAKDILVSKISNLQILDVLPSGVSLANGDDAIKREDGKIQINLKDIIFDSVSSTPGAFTVKLDVVFNKSGYYSFNQGVINYIAYNGVNGWKPINNVSVTVLPNQEQPGVEVHRQADNTAAVEGEVVEIKYSFTPTGAFVDQPKLREPVDIVLVMDKSLSMMDKTGKKSKNKLTDAKAAAINFVNAIADNGYNDRISLVTFNRHSKVDVNLTTNYNTVISEINSIDPDDESNYDQGTNYEIGLNTAKSVLANSGSSSKYIVFLSDGEPNFYVDSYENNKDWRYYYYNDKTFYTYYWWYGADNAYSNFREDYRLADRNLDNGDYTYLGDAVYAEVENAAKSIAKLGITIHTIGLGSAEDLDMGFMADIAQAGGGNAYESADSEDLEAIFTDISNNISQQKLSNLTVTMNLPENVEVLEDVSLTRDGSQITFRIPDIIFEENEGTPSPVEYTLKLRFNKAGTYHLSNDAVLSFVDAEGKEATKVFNDISLDILKADYAISELHAEPQAINQQVSSIQLTWSIDEIDLISNVKEFVLQRSIDGGVYEDIGIVSSSTTTYTDNDVSQSGSYVYRIITVVKGQNDQPDERVIGAISNAIEITTAVSNISSITSANLINNLLNSNTVVDGFRVKSLFTIEIVDEFEGVSAGGIKNPSFIFKLNENNNPLVDCKFSSNSKIQLLDSNRNLIFEQIIHTGQTETKMKQIELNYNNILAPGTYYIEFSFIPEKTIGSAFPEGGIEINNSMKMIWQDNGINHTKDSDELFGSDSEKDLEFDIFLVKKPILN